MGRGTTRAGWGGGRRRIRLGSRGGISRYKYSADNPVNAKDASGTRETWRMDETGTPIHEPAPDARPGGNGSGSKPTDTVYEYEDELVRGDVPSASPPSQAQEETFVGKAAKEHREFEAKQHARFGDRQPGNTRAGATGFTIYSAILASPALVYFAPGAARLGYTALQSAAVRTIGLAGPGAFNFTQQLLFEAAQGEGGTVGPSGAAGELGEEGLKLISKHLKDVDVRSLDELGELTSLPQPSGSLRAATEAIQAASLGRAGVSNRLSDVFAMADDFKFPKLEPGDLFLEFQVGDETLEFGANIAIEGKTMSVTGVALFTKGKKSGSPGFTALQTMFMNLAAQAKAQGIEQLVIESERLTGVAVGRKFHKVINLTGG